MRKKIGAAAVVAMLLSLGFSMVAALAEPGAGKHETTLPSPCHG